jgi:hypothetical protein
MTGSYKLEFAVLAVVIPVQLRGAVIAGPITNPANGHTYYLLSQNTWTASEAEALTLDGHLVTVNDADENAWIFSTFSQFGGISRALWIGLTDAGHEGQFTWISGDPSTFTLWSGAQPDNGVPGPAENYVHLLWPTHPQTPGQWNDFQNLSSVNTFVLNGVVEVEVDKCPADINADGEVDVDDLIAVILGWGPCPAPPAPCLPDIDRSGSVDVDDLIAVILAWGPCRS